MAARLSQSEMQQLISETAKEAAKEAAARVLEQFTLCGTGDAAEYELVTAAEEGSNTEDQGDDKLNGGIHSNVSTGPGFPPDIASMEEWGESVVNWESIVQGATFAELLRDDTYRTYREWVMKQGKTRSAGVADLKNYFQRAGLGKKINGTEFYSAPIPGTTKPRLRRRASKCSASGPSSCSEGRGAGV
jgi:hypothetical protein